MIKRRNKQIINDILFKQSTLSLIGFLILVAISFPLVKNINKQYKINNEIAGLEKEIEEFENKNMELKETFTYLESDQFASEQARINLNYKKEGEEVVVIKSFESAIVNNDQSNTYSVQGINNNIPIKNPSNATLWWRYFFY